MAASIHFLFIYSLIPCTDRSMSGGMLLGLDKISPLGGFNHRLNCGFAVESKGDPSPSDFTFRPSPQSTRVLSSVGPRACSDRKTWCVVISEAWQRAEGSYLGPLEESWGTRWGPTGLIKTRRARDGAALHFTRERANASVWRTRCSPRHARTKACLQTQASSGRARI